MSTKVLKAVATEQAAAADNGAGRPRTIYEYLENRKVKEGLAAVAGAYLKPERMLRLCVNAVKKAPLLTQCDPQTVLGAMMTSAALGLEPNTVQQQAFLIPYKRRKLIGNDWVDVYECQFQIGARGFVTLAYRSPSIKMIQAEAIHAGDRFEHMLGSETFLRYSKSLTEDRGVLIGAFSYVRLANGDENACVLPLAELLKIRAKSETYVSLVSRVEQASNERDRMKAMAKLAETPWVMWEDDMAAKSAIKKHSKQLPLSDSDALAAAAEIDSRSEMRTLDLKTMTDPDAVRAVVGEGMMPPALEHSEPETFEFPLGAEAEGVPLEAREDEASYAEKEA